MTEHVLVVPTSRFRTVGGFHGFRSENLYAYQSKLFTREFFSYLPRPLAEQNPLFKQIIPYCIFTFGDRVLSYYRTKKAGETRLRGKRSIGIGGHISSDDTLGEKASSLDCFIRTGMLREIHEELGESVNIEGERLFGLVNEDETEVGRVHLGVVYWFQIRGVIESNDDGLAGLSLEPLSDLVKSIDEFELWSQFILKELTLRSCFGPDMAFADLPARSVGN